MSLTFKAAFLVSLIFLATLVTHAQEKKVRILRFEIDGRPVKAKFKVDIITDDQKIHRAKTDQTGFIVPGEVMRKSADTYVGVLISFNKFVLTFFAMRRSNFDTDWLIVGIDTKPFEADKHGDANPAEVKEIYYVQFAGEPERNMIVTVSKPKITIKRMN